MTAFTTDTICPDLLAEFGYELAAVYGGEIKSLRDLISGRITVVDSDPIFERIMRSASLDGEPKTFRIRERAERHQFRLEQAGFSSVVLLTTHDGVHVVSATRTDCGSSLASVVMGFAAALLTPALFIGAWIGLPS